NVVDIWGLHAVLRLPVIVVARRPPNLRAIESALCSRVRGGLRKWRLIERAGPMEPAGAVWIQRAGIDLPETRRLVTRLAIAANGAGPLGVGHFCAGALATGWSRGRV